MILRKKGFTLIELLIVVVIIAIIAAIVLMKINDSRHRARVAATRSTLSGLRAGIEMCCGSGGTLLTITGGEMCSKPVGIKLPKATDLGATSVFYLTNSMGTAYGITPTSCSGNNPGYFISTSGGYLNKIFCTTWTVTEKFGVMVQDTCKYK